MKNIYLACSVLLSGCGAATLSEMTYQERQQLVAAEMDKCIASGVASSQAYDCARENILVRDRQIYSDRQYNEQFAEALREQSRARQAAAPRVIEHTGMVTVNHMGGMY